MECTEWRPFQLEVLLVNDVPVSADFIESKFDGQFDTFKVLSCYHNWMML